MLIEVAILRPKTQDLKTHAQGPRPRPEPRRYNIPVPGPTPPNDDKHHRHAVYASETIGLLLIAYLILAAGVLIDNL